MGIIHNMRKLFIIFSLAFLCAACSAGDNGSQIVDASLGDTGVHSNSAGGSAVTVESLAVQPAFTKIKGIGKTIQLSADIWLDGGAVLNDIQSSFTVDGVDGEQTLDWSTENFGVVTVDDNGLVTTVSAGDTFIKAVIDGHEAVARIIVEAESSPEPNIDLSDPE